MTVTCDAMLIFFFLIQQFITRSVEADHGSYFITTYIITETICGRKERKKQKKREKDENESEVKPNKYKEMEKC